MRKELFTYLHSYSREPVKVDRLIVSSFLYSKGINRVNNRELKKYFIALGDNDYLALKEFLKIKKDYNFEELIELFEFVISPEDKIINGAVYTPQNIRKFLVDTTLNVVEQLENPRICDPACGCAGFLFSLAIELNKKRDFSFFKIFSQVLYGLDIEEYSVQRSKLLLTLAAILNGEDEPEFSFNIHQGNALDFKWNEYVKNFQGFDIVIGNPPYVISKNMGLESLELIKNWSVSKSGHPDLYIPFFQLGIENLAERGVMAYITVNTFFKSINGRALRAYLSERNLNFKIIDFGSEQVFRGRSTYTCICIIENRHSPELLYTRKKSNQLGSIKEEDFYAFNYQNLHDHDGWNLVSDEECELFIKRIENTGNRFQNRYMTRNGIATLKNSIYKFIPKDEDELYFYRVEDKFRIPIEKSICRKVINANGIGSEDDIIKNEEKIIFPYIWVDGKRQVMEEKMFQAEYPMAYQYLNKQRRILEQRDKGKREYEAWFAFGRTQSLDIVGYKLFFPHISKSPKFIISEDLNLLFYNGLAVISEDLGELRILKAVLETKIFWYYIKETSKYYASGHKSMARNYIKNFGIPEFSKEEKEIILGNANKIEVELMIESKYKSQGTQRNKELTQLDLEFEIANQVTSKIA